MSILNEQKVNANVHLSIITDDAHSKSKIPSPSDPLISSNLPRSTSRSNRHAGSSFLRNIESKIWITALILPLVPIAGFAVYLFFNGRYIGLESKKIGDSSLSQVQAKVIDFLCSVVIAPCIVTVFDYLWFSYAHVLAVNEVLPKGGIPIEALASISSTDSGSFNLMKFWGLIYTRKWTLFLFGLMVLLSGSTKSLFSNVIAYEASNIVGGETKTVNLQSLAAPFQWTHFLGAGGNGEFAIDLNLTQQADFSSQFLGMLTDLTFHSGADKLEDKYYIGINATTASLNALPSPVASLSEVPAYRLSIDCRVTTPTRFSALPLSRDGNVQISLSVGDDPTKPNNTAILYIAGFTGGLQTAFAAAGGASRAFAAFTADDRTDYRLYLGYTSTIPPFGGMNNTGIRSSFGELKYYLNNQTDEISSEPVDTHQRYIWGISCKVARQTGFHKVERTDTRSWKRVANAGRYEEKTDLIPLHISSLAWTLGYRVPLHRSMPGFGPVFTTGVTADDPFFSNDKMALNALYAIGETERMLNDIGMENAGQNGTFQVSAGMLEQRYQITYVPLLVFGGLLSCLCACLITFGLLVYHWWKQSHSFRIWRKVTVTRLLADAVDGLRDENDFYHVSGLDNTALGEWGEDYHVRYVKGTDETGVTIKLKKV